jgi:hypothetical protein
MNIVINLVLAFAAGFLTCVLVVAVGYRRAENQAFRSFWL